MENRGQFFLYTLILVFFSPYGSLYISQGIDQETSLAEDRFLYSHVVNVLTLDVDLVVVV